MRVRVEADGGSRGNPGPAGYGACVLDPATGATLAERAAGIGSVAGHYSPAGDNLLHIVAQWLETQGLACKTSP